MGIRGACQDLQQVFMSDRNVRNEMSTPISQHCNNKTNKQQRGWDLGFPALHRHHSGTGRKDTQKRQALWEKIFCYRIIVHWVTCSWVRRLLTEPAGDPREMCVYAKVFP